MSREDLKKFPCGAEELLEIIRVIILKNAWNHPKAKEWFLSLVGDIYRDVSPEIAACIYFSFKWMHVAEILLFGKNHGIPEGDWFVAVEECFRKNSSG